MALANGAEAEPVDQTGLPEIEQHSTKVLMLGALGVVYGDIGTSPIYAFREALHASSGGDVANRADILGVLSLIIWSLTITVTIKYIMFVLRADNRGEGGVLSLMALARGSFATRSAIILGIGIVGASLFFGDAVITPAISVLSAVEGMNVVTPTFQPYVVPLTLLILALVFAVQRFGTGGVGLVFGPVTAIWFLAIGLSGLKHIIDDPEILWAISPHYIVAFLINSPDVSFVTIGAVFLAVTGAEALYADLGHFGRKPIVLAWLAIVFPCLLLNYAGQGAYVLAKGGTVGHPFFEMNEGWALIPMVVLATAATVIASQAVISGAYSLTRQAVQLNMLPRLEILHTSEKQSGQVYMPRVNMLLALVVMLLVVGFGESSRLASAYGISVTGNMLVTTTLLFVVMTRIWKWNIWPAAALTALFALIDIGFFASNIVKVFEGGWASLAVAFAIILGMWTWVRGSRYLFDKTRRNEIPLDFLAANLLKKKPQLVSGTAVFLTSDPLSAPTALMHSLKHYKVLHEKNVILSVVTAPQPVVPDSERVKMETVNELFMRVTLTFGYMEQPNIPRALAICRKQGWKFDIMTTSFFLSRRSLKASPNSGMPIWQDRLFIGLAKTAADATEYFQIPTGRVVEIGTQVAI
ncbi:potassium transporter Kup [Mesorhizobium sp. M1C.F.Ca.ET.193.01.1.1]|uniref:potassium transporter Kup n=1 Tax=unclassified Mesorhizobium TaxID=325217 RepID=UPI000FD274A6|nr:MULTISPECIES: potassium transporter Kup [unclassified Mesorhizobium]TGT02665.1 potassium transporter Kup [bacterium M00.F.Ca.ET.177.01.1.1]TGQ55525.1 potassium transporter Kup [Mesorhizobium sp. M1C.F.Ca.ET.210.01.1.1]TGQ73980.1 potassium transporter Kup [Mesorhizobium sp. M1C.F.Ca.ET.212.01.1.1]TGR12609.1 potassium transporter Kup [Mesorhizobium sp. M1C.F.Ca.ET.204.01.1.1]TGR32568.1 potassium transporter Kup [Mesorhizobium sp. M1C.F.Ca.ET.196.01.1.1]